MGLLSKFAPKRPGPTADEVLTLAVAELTKRVPASYAITRESSAVRIAFGDFATMWNLHDVIRLAPQDPEWREGVASLASQIATQVTNRDQTGGRAAATAPRNERLEVRLRPSERFLPGIPESMRGEILAIEVAPGICAFLAWTSGGPQMKLALRSQLGGRTQDEALAQAIENTLGPEEEVAALMGPIGDSAIFTNQEFHPNVAALLLLPSMWTGIAESFRVAPSKILALAPAPSRIFFSIDEPGIAAALRNIGQSAIRMEEEILSPQVLRFTGSGWVRYEEPN